MFSRERRIVASFGAANLIRCGDGHWELRGGPPEDHAAAREWCSMFQHEATFPSARLPVGNPEASAAKSAPTRILIADDDPTVRGSLAAVLESEGYVVDEARNGVEAVARAVIVSPNLVLLDLSMPQWDGWAAFSRLKQAAPRLPTIVITARPNQYGEAVRLRVDAFMEKPLNIPVLVRAIQRLIREGDSRQTRRAADSAFVTELLGGGDSR